MPKQEYRIKIKALWDTDRIYFRVKDILSLTAISYETFMREFNGQKQRYHRQGLSDIFEHSRLYVGEDLYISEYFFFDNEMEEDFVEKFENIFPSVNMFLDQRYGILVEASKVEKEENEKKKK